MVRRAVLFCLAVLLISAAAIAQSPVPDLPADVPATAQMSSVLSSGNLAGQQAVWTDADGTHVFYQFNDRGRGPKLTSVYKLNGKSIPTAVIIAGNDYMKAPVEEKFTLERGGIARWKNPSEDASAKNAAGKFYSTFYGPPEETAIAVRAALANGGKLGLLPTGAIRVERVRDMRVVAGDESVDAKLYAITGFDLSPSLIWLDQKNQFFASGGSWGMTIRKGFESAQKQIVDAQEEYSQARLKALAATAARHPAGDLVIRNVSLFDSETGKVIPNQTVVVRGNRIAAVRAADAKDAGTKGMIIDGTGKMLLPGLWDMHAHVNGNDPLLNIMNGVTTVRDMANDIDALTDIRKRIDSGQEIGTRIIPAGFIDGPGPFQGPSKILADTEEQARKYVDMYHELGYPQIKIYSSLKPELVPAIIDEAHKNGMRVSGHIPAGMTAEQCVRLGQDEIQHMNMIFLNFMPDVKETRTPARFIEPGKRGAALDLKSVPVQNFIRLLREKHIVVDPTMTAWEGTYIERPGTMSPTFAAVADRLPAQIQRGLYAAGQSLPVTPETDELYRASYAKMVQMVKELYDGGVQLVAGTDNFAGFSYHRELEIYNQAGIPAPEVLRIATLQSATVMKKDAELGSIAEGKLADMVLVAGDPTKNIADIRKVKTVIKDGAVIEAADIARFLGIKPSSVQ